MKRSVCRWSAGDSPIRIEADPPSEAHGSWPAVSARMLCRGSTRLAAGGETTASAHRYQPDSPRPALLVTLSQSSFDVGSDSLRRPPAARRGRPRVAPFRCRRPSELTIASATPPVSGLRALRRRTVRLVGGVAAELARSRSPRRVRPAEAIRGSPGSCPASPAFVLAQALAAEGVRVAPYVRQRQSGDRRPHDCSVADGAVRRSGRRGVATRAQGKRRAVTPRDGSHGLQLCARHTNAELVAEETVPTDTPYRNP
jgi:hypothetical protein